MKRIFPLVCLVLIWGVVYAQRQAGQNLVITNARIIDGNGGVIPRGSVVVRNGRIASVSAGNASEPGARQIDVRGMTVMSGFIGDPSANVDDLLKVKAVIKDGQIVVDKR